MSLNPSEFNPTPYNPTPFTPSSDPSYTPVQGNYKQLQPFRYWCQKVLPLVYDDSLSYYELLCKVVDYLNKTMEDVDTLHIDVDNLHTAYEALQADMTNKYHDITTWINSTYGDMTTWMNTSYQALVDFCNNYFANLDVQQEINNKLDAMTESGELTTLIAAYVDPIYQAYETRINNEVNTFKTDVNAQMSTQNGKITILEQRMDSFSNLPNGSTSGDAELADIRVGENGVTYPNAGDAVRGQFKQTWEDGIYETITITTNEGGFINPNNGEIAEYEGWKYTNFTDISNSKSIIAVSYRAVSSQSRYNAFYDANQNYISTYSLNEKVDVPTNAKYTRLSAPVACDLFLTSLSYNSIKTLNEDLYDLNEGVNDTPYSSPKNAITEQFEETWFKNVSYEADLDITTGGYINANTGELVTYAGWKYSDYYDISNFKKIIAISSDTAVSNDKYNAFYDEDHTFISNFHLNTGEIEVPNHAKYVRLSITVAGTLRLKCVKYNSLKVLDEKIENTLNIIETKSIDTSYKVKYALPFKAGNLQPETGVETGANFTRLHSDAYYSHEDLILINTRMLRSAPNFVKIFYWDSKPSSNSVCDSTDDWIQINTDTPVVITGGKWFKLLFANNSISSDITDPYDNYYFNGIEILKPSIISIEDLNPEAETIVQALKTTYPENAQNYFSPVYDPITFLHFSDIHRNATLWKRIGEYMDYHNSDIEFGIMTGDYVEDNQTEYTDLYNAYTPYQPLYNCVGNHDTYEDNNHQTASKSSVYNKLFNHQTNWNVTFAPLSNSMTYYKDFSNKKIRMIVLDNYYDIEAQLTWLANTLADAKTLGYSVITFSHQVTDAPHDKVNCTFQTLIPYEDGNFSSVVYTPFDDVIADFKNNGGKHIAHFSGHEHENWFYKTESGVLNISIQNAGTYMGWSEGYRKPYTKSWDCFNVVGIDINFGIIKIVRLGANVDAYNRTLNVITYDYTHDTVIFNS